MYLYIQNKQGQEIGKIMAGNKFVARCYNLQRRYLGKILEHSKHLFAFDENDNYIGRYDGENSYNKYNDNLGKGNLYITFFTLRLIKYCNRYFKPRKWREKRQNA